MPGTMVRAPAPVNDGRRPCRDAPAPRRRGVDASRSGRRCRRTVMTKSALAVTLLLAAVSLPAPAQDLARAEQLFERHCAVCHGADRGGYIGPALNRDETRIGRAEIDGKILSGAPPTLMPQHPS
ncbi:MAG: c-type cytochrome, partial [Comamonadaceae bacterium]|nr:c-type cytochrome [Comamonadaceae bacterium]